MAESPVLSFDGTLGAAFLGHFTTAVLYGITSLQTFIYFRQHYNDPLSLRSLIIVLWICDSIHTALVTHVMYFYLVTNFTNVAAVAKPIWSITAMIMVSNISNSICDRISAMEIGRPFAHSSCRYWFTVVFNPTMMIKIGDGFYFAVECLKIPSYVNIRAFSWSLYVGFSAEVVVDGIITVSQCLLLRRFRTGFRSTDSMVHVLMAYSINTGLLTSLCAIACLITYTTLQHEYVYFAFYFVLSKLYVNSLLANLNARGSLLDKKPSVNMMGGEQKIVLADTSVGDHDQYRRTSTQFTTVMGAALLTSDSSVITIMPNSPHHEP
ncbi:hypothetical protein A0H81_07242 [Grifola frondosa]|uniref:DUF6534 domain-containing protein n=1 Tax=Grifola frondosa TaxID=5627 RepID=A0A1C7M9Q7_GRIFR|nr:hypothetical protein A0H81_07242 [Grifola frondosa]